MSKKRRVINFILSFVCCLCVFFGSCMKSRALEYPVNGKYDNINYSFTDSFDMYFYGGSGVKNYKFSIPVHVCIAQYNNQYEFIACSLENFGCNGTVAYSGLYDGRTVYWYTESGSANNLSFSIPVNITTSSNNAYNIINSIFWNYYISENFDDLKEFVPDFDNYYHEDTDRWVNDLRANVEEDILYSTWNGLAGEGLHVLEGYENIYVQFHLQFIDDKGTASIEDDEYTNLYDFYTELAHNEFSVELSSFEVLEGYRLWAMYAEPYWYFNDDVNSTLFKGKLTYLFFDENGVSDAPLIKDTGDIYNPLDPNLSNWNAITNFTGDYFYNMNNVINNWDSSGMDASNEKLNNSLQGFSQQEDAILNQVSNNLTGFDFDEYLTFGDKVTNGIAFGSGLINKFFEVSGDLTILFVVGCVMVFVFIVVGIWRFSK